MAIICVKSYREGYRTIEHHMFDNILKNVKDITDTICLELFKSGGTNCSYCGRWFTPPACLIQTLFFTIVYVYVFTCCPSVECSTRIQEEVQAIKKHILPKECSVCGVSEKEYKSSSELSLVCPRCGIRSYCSIACQRKDNKQHKQSCKFGK